MEAERRGLLIVANRLPVTLKPLGDRDYDFQPSSGGLAAGLNGLGKRSKWFGWPGLEVPRKDIKPLETKLASNFGAVPVWLSNTLAKHHYNGFSSTSGSRVYPGSICTKLWRQIKSCGQSCMDSKTKWCLMTPRLWHTKL